MKIPDSTVSVRPLVPALFLAAAAVFAVGRPAEAQPPEGSLPPGAEALPQGQEEAQATQADDPTRTAGGALRLFMASRDYRTIKRLKGVMTERLQGRFDHDSAPFNGKRGNRLAAFDFTEKDLKPPRAAAGKPPAPPASYLGSVRSLWEEQGEATENRIEIVTIAQRDDGLWRIADLTVASSEKLRFMEAVNGVTVLRMVLRAWHRGNPATARANMSDGFLKKFQGKDEALKAMFAAAEGRGHAAYQIAEMTPQGTAAAVARVRLYETVIGEPGPIDVQVHALKMVRKGSRWLLDGWE